MADSALSGSGGHAVAVIREAGQTSSVTSALLNSGVLDRGMRENDKLEIAQIDRFGLKDMLWQLVVSLDSA